MIFLLCIQLLFAFRPLNVTHTSSKLYKNYIFYMDDSTLSYSTLQSPHSQKIIQQNIIDFDLNDNHLAVWNQTVIMCYILNDQINSTILQVTKQLEILNQNFSNITITSLFLLAQFTNQTLYVYNTMNQKEKYLNPIYIDSLNKSQSQEIYRYNEKNAFSYLNTDHKFHAIIFNENITELNEKVWFSVQNSIFSAQFWNNGTAIFLNQHHINYTVPLNQLFWYHEDSSIKIKYLFTIQDAHVYAIYTNKAICFQYYSRNLQTSYQNIMCMKVDEEFYQIIDVNFRYRLQFIMKHNQTNEIAIDYYNQCILFTTLPLEESCSMCLNENCKNECHSLKQYNCSDNSRIRGSLPFTMITFCFALMVVYTVIEILKFIIKSFALTLSLFCMILKFIFYNIPKMFIQRTKRIYLRFRRKITQLPITNTQECPICLGEIVSPQYFPCNRHAACLDCYEQYEATFHNQQIKCPYRDQ